MPSREKVRAFYERHPYPPPVDSLETYRRLWQDRQRRRADFHLAWPAQRLPRGSLDPDRRLRDVAGGQARAALARGARDRHRLQRDQRPPHRGAQAQVRSRQPRGPPAPRRARRRAGGDLRPDRLHRRSPSPRRTRTRGWRRCATCCGRTARCTSWSTRRTDGPASTCCRSSAGGSASPPPTTGFAISSPRSARCRPATRWRRCCARRRTSGSAAALADALLHPQDRAYSVPQLFELLAGAGLTFGRWVWQAPYSPRCGVMARIPQAARLAAASARRSSTPPSSCSAARCFATAWSCTATTTARAARAARASPATPGAATCRFACRTRSASRRSCRRGAAAVLINREPHLPRHLPADRRAREAAVRRHRRHAHDRRDRAGTDEQLDAARVLFERLYWHDQVAFDASGSGRERSDGASA